MWKKLNLVAGGGPIVLNQPEHLDLGDLPEGEVLRTEVDSNWQFLIAFVQTQAGLDSLAAGALPLAEGDAIFWVAYPKQSSKRLQCEFNRDTGWASFGQMGWEPVRQVAIDEDWSALRFRKVEFIKSLTRRKSMAISPEGKSRTSGD